MFFDSHTHINNDDYTEEARLELIKEIEKSDVDFVMDVGFDPASSVMAAEHAAKYEWCYAAAGCHPHDTDKMDDIQLGIIKSLARKEKVKAIGEIGLDFHYDLSPRDIQCKWFRKQIQLANELRMPIIIHAREADEEVMNILKEEGAFSKERCGWFPPRVLKDLEPAENAAALEGFETGKEYPDARVVLHCFSGSAELGKQYVKLGATLSAAGPLTYKNSKKGIKVVQSVPIQFLFVETDAPYLTPEPLRGRPNMSPYVRYTAAKVAEIKGMQLEDVAAITCDNARRFFEI
ncbi:MAG: TatD family hydrolase [Clostridia bacterium]|nr:TatD family hydrolase [Clostridia bacterium]